jgi:hypothetical protein
MNVISAMLEYPTGRHLNKGNGHINIQMIAVVSHSSRNPLKTTATIMSEAGMASPTPSDIQTRFIFYVDSPLMIVSWKTISNQTNQTQTIRLQRLRIGLSSGRKYPFRFRTCESGSTEQCADWTVCACGVSCRYPSG